MMMYILENQIEKRQKNSLKKKAPLMVETPISMMSSINWARKRKKICFLNINKGMNQRMKLKKKKIQNLSLLKNTTTTVIHLQGIIKILIMYSGTIRTYIKAVFTIHIIMDIIPDLPTGDLGGIYLFHSVIDGVDLVGEAIIGGDLAMVVMDITILGATTLGIMIVIIVLHIIPIEEM